MIEYAVSAFTTLIVVLDPIGLVPLFLALTAHFDPRQRTLTAIWATSIAGGVLIAFALIGRPLLDALGITLPAFRIAGGLLLFYTAFEMVFDVRGVRRQSAADSTGESHDPRSIAAFPLAIPLLAGPGAITAVILLSGEAGTLAAKLPLVGVIIAASLIVLATFLAAGVIDRTLGHTLKIVVTRLLGVLLAALAIQYVADGVLALASRA